MAVNPAPADTVAALSAGPVDDALLRWQLDVAVRADELARGTPGGKDRDLRVWLQAEEEVWDKHFSAATR